MKFKKDFVFGAATSSYQIEGAAYSDGKGEHIWDVYTHESGKIFEDHNGDVACDHYNRYKEDVAIMKRIGLKAYRFSISWARIFPNGTGEVNEKGVRFYSDLIDELIKNGIEPYITLFHWDYPYELYKKGGWMNEDSVNWFAEYARLVVERFSDRVKYFITFNEPQCFIGIGFWKGRHAPGLKCPARDVFLMCHNVLKAHGAAVIAMRAAAKQKIYIGYAPTCTATYPASEAEEDVQAAKDLLFACPDLKNWTWNVSWWSDPVILGKYPEDGLEKYKEYLPKITEADMKLIHQPIDFYCQNIYQGVEVRSVNGKPEVMPRKAGYPMTTMGWAITPNCLNWTPRFLYERYKLPFYISENGMAAHDRVSSDGFVHDLDRIEYLKAHLEAYGNAAENGCDACGYFQWSFMDNFEWAFGYSERFGIVHVDYETQKRTIKDSGLWYSDLIRDFYDEK